MEKSKRYYWIKLKTDFFNLAEIDFLLSQKNGCDYIVLYQMLCLQTANNNGILASRLGEIIVPYDPDKIVRDTKYFNKDTVLVVMGLFRKLNLIYEDEGNCLRISGFENMVGSETAWAKEKREQREKQKLLSGQCPENVLTDIEIDKDIDRLNDRLYLLIKQKIKKSKENYNYLQDIASELKNQRVRNEDNIEKIPIFKVNKGKDSYYFLTRKNAQEFIKAYKIEDIGKIEIEENDKNSALSINQVFL